MAQLLNLGSKKIHAMNRPTARFKRADCGASLVKSGAVTVRQLVWKLRSQWRLAMRPRQSRGRFGYDPESYSQNFDDGHFH